MSFLQSLATVAALLMCLPALALAKPPPPPKATTMEQELEASITQLTATRDKLRKDASSAPPKTTDMLAQELALVELQLDSVNKTLAMLRRARPAIDKQLAERPTIPDSLKPVFAPLPAAKLPTWISDDIERSAVTAATMKCPANAEVYEDAAIVSCAIPGNKGRTPSVRDGLTLSFVSGRLESQRFYEQGRLRWSIEYHLTHGRAYVGAYVDGAKLERREDGVHTRYSPNGTVQYQAEYERGVLHGWTRLYEYDGYPIVAERYQRGVLIETVSRDGTREVRKP